MEMAKTVEEYFVKHPNHRETLEKLRKLLNSTELSETLKWGMPTYTLDNKNVVGIGAFKAYAGIWFFNGAFLRDEDKVLVNAQEGKTKGMRQWRFASPSEINELRVLDYIREAIQNQKDGKEIKAEKKALFIPDQLKEALASDAELSEAYDALTAGKQGEYAAYITEAKREETKQKRLEKIAPMIKEGIGLNDKYK